MLMIAVTFSGCDRSAAIRGSAFIVTRGGNNVKLGLVQVSALSEDAAVEHLKKKYQEFIAPKGGWRTEAGIAQGQAESVDFARHIFESLPPSTAKALTDADGRFAIPVVKGKSYYIVAKASRENDTTREEYFWFIHAQAVDPPQDVILSNQNLLNDKAAITLLVEAEARVMSK